MRYFIGFLVTIGLIIVIVFLLLTGGGKGKTTVQPLTVDSFVNSDTAVAEMIIDSPIQANQIHNDIKIDVTKAEVTMTVYQGYDQTVLRGQSYVNNDQSFAAFMHALQHAGFTKGNKDPLLKDERGYCPSGNRTIYSLSTAEKQLIRYWRTSCGEGTFGGSISVVNYLFRQQIPMKDFQALTKDLPTSL